MTDVYVFPQQPDVVPTDEKNADGETIYVNRVRYIYRPEFPEIEIPVGRKTDLLSSPRWLKIVFPSDDLYRPAAFVHDELYRGEGQLRDAAGRVWVYTRADADDILLEIMTRQGIPQWKRFLAWAAVRLFGGSHWGP